ncbi:MAG: cation diffusion facilitator family transporter [Oscillospiraceae bacterium]|nr:cation diffusion facilitator family transporter [Oscillospiraceae bacterium]
MEVSAVSLLVNILLSAGKLLAGILAHSGAMISDSVHSASDVVSTLVVIVGLRLSGRRADANHPYGHERLECAAAILLSGMLALTGAGIGLTGIREILQVLEGNLTIQTPGLLALGAAVVSVAVKEAMYWYTRRAARKLGSAALMADAWHHRSDALSSVGSFAGILGARLGWPVLDPVASVVICAFILRAAVKIFMDAVGQMTDRACDAETEQTIREIILAQPGVEGIDLLKTRRFSSKIYVDVEIAADGNKTLYETHAIAEAVHTAIETSLDQVKHIMVHVNPLQLPEDAGEGKREDE